MASFEVAVIFVIGGAALSFCSFKDCLRAFREHRSIANLLSPFGLLIPSVLMFFYVSTFGY